MNTMGKLKIQKSKIKISIQNLENEQDILEDLLLEINLNNLIETEETIVFFQQEKENSNKETLKELSF